MIATTIEQSNRILALGIPKETADCWWCAYVVGYNGTPCIFTANPPILYSFNWGKDPKNIPAWSFERLIRICENHPNFYNTYCLREGTDLYERLIWWMEFQKREGFDWSKITLPK